MEIYLVGGAVRDQLLGLDVYDKDYVVVGGSEVALLNLGYTKVGRDFPVFLHPKTKAEYALARSETKVSRGYLGFNTQIQGVSLAEDLRRRDITINAMAIDNKGVLIDCVGGQQDLQLGMIRHTSPAFIEDPLRILRVARFAAKLKPYGFKVAPSTHQLMSSMAQNGELALLSGERIFNELHKALTYHHSSAFFEILVTCGAYNILFGTGKMEQQHPNIFTQLDGNHPAIIKFALWLQHYDLTTIQNITKILKVPNKFNALTVLAYHHKSHIIGFNSLSDKAKLAFFLSVDSFRNAERFEQLLSVYTLMNHDVSQIRKQYKLLATIKFNTNVKDGITVLKQQRLQLLRQYAHYN